MPEHPITMAVEDAAEGFALASAGESPVSRVVRGHTLYCPGRQDGFHGPSHAAPVAHARH